MKNRFTEEQIIKVLKEHEGGRPATDIVRELGIAEQTYREEFEETVVKTTEKTTRTRNKPDKKND